MLVPVTCDGDNGHFLLHFWTALAQPDHFGVSNLAQLQVLAEKINIEGLLAVNLALRRDWLPKSISGAE
jgi:hypothetical protein